jgi:hypothetical protein
MEKKLKFITDVSFAKYLDMQDLAERLAITNSKIVDHKGGFFLDKSIYKTPPLKDGTVFVDANVFYSPGKFGRYIMIDNNGKYALKEEQPPNTCAFFAKVTKFEDYELSTVDQRILEAVRRNEEFRKSGKISG